MLRDVSLSLELLYPSQMEHVYVALYAQKCKTLYIRPPAFLVLYSRINSPFFTWLMYTVPLTGP